MGLTRLIFKRQPWLFMY